MAENDQVETHYVEKSSGWSSLWKWVGTIVVVLIIAMVVIYVANTFLMGEQIRAGSTDDSSGLQLNITTEEPSASGDGESTE